MGAHGEEETRKLSSHAWLYDHGLKRFVSLPEAGMLIAIGDRVSLVTKKGLVFEADRAEIQVKWPRSGLGMAFYLTVGDQTYRLSLARPKGAATFDEETRKSRSKATIDFLTEGDVKDLVLGVRDIHRGRASGKAWEAYFGGTEMAASAPEEHATAAEHPAAAAETATAPEEHEQT